jgi:flagellar protein FliJ
MHAFRFPLEAVLLLREREEQAARLALSHALARLRDAEGALRSLAGERDRTAEGLEQVTSMGTCAAEIEWHVRHLAHLHQQIEDGEREVAEARAEGLRLHDLWVEAERKCRILERMREKAYEQHIQERRKAEDRELDETTTIRWGREALP